MTHSNQTQQPTSRRFQFSLRVLLVFTAVAAVLVAISVEYYRNQLASEVSQRPGRFHRAIQQGDLAEMDRLLRIDPTLAEGRKRGGFSSSHAPLHYAVLFGGNPKAVDRILKEQPDVNETSEDGETALHVAVQLGMVSLVQRLIKQGADLNIADEEGKTPLHVAVERDRTGQMTKLLLDAGADPNRIAPATANDSRYRGKSPLQTAAKHGLAGTVDHLLRAGANANYRDAEGRTALHIALAGSGTGLEFAQHLVKHGADLTAKDDQGLLPGEQSDDLDSYNAVRIWSDQIAMLLEKNEVDRLNEMLSRAPQALSFRTSHTPETLLHSAIQVRRLDVLDFLLDRGIDPDLRGHAGQSALHDACWGPIPVAYAKRLVEAGADIEAKDNHGRTPLHAAAREHHPEVLRLLLDQGANFAAVDKYGTTVLDAAFLRTFRRDEGLKSLQVLRSAGHKPTILYAAATGNVDLLRELTGGDLTMLDRGNTRSGIHPLHAAVLAGQRDTVDWLLSQGVKQDPPVPSDWGYASQETPLLASIDGNLPGITVLLIENGCNVNRPSSVGYPLHRAVYKGSDVEVVEKLLAHGADPMLMHQKKTAMDFAEESKSKHRKRYLELLNAALKDE
jgi:serine/threonine-protein phosphatase 6 regulatory ankyrin repeat subunit B